MEFLVKQMSLDLWVVVLINVVLLVIGITVGYYLAKFKQHKEDEIVEEHEIISTVPVKKSTKEFKCAHCGYPIPEGSSYVRVSYRTSSGIGSNAYHNECNQNYYT